MPKNLDVINSESNSIFRTIVIVIVIVGIAYLIYYLYNQYTMNKKKEMIKTGLHNIKMERMDNMVNEEAQQEQNIDSVTYKMTGTLTGVNNPIMSKTTTLPKGKIVGQEDVEHFSQNQNQTLTDQRNASSFPKEQLTAEELLPQDNSSLWAQVNPSGEGSLKDRNFLQSGYHIGINTVGQTLRNANLQLRSEPPCPQVQVSPWSQSTIESDVSRKPFEIGGCQ